MDINELDTTEEDLKLTIGEAFIYSWQRSGEFGHFKEALINLLVRANKKELDKLATIYPNEVQAYVSYRNIPGWWEKLEEKVEKIKVFNEKRQKN